MVTEHFGSTAAAAEPVPGSGYPVPMRDDAAAVALPLHRRVRHGMRHPRQLAPARALRGSSARAATSSTSRSSRLPSTRSAIDYRVAAVLAFLVSVANNFWWNRHWTFDARDGHAGFQAARFLAVSVVAFRFSLRACSRLLVAGAGPAEGARAGDRDRRRHAAVVPRPEALELPQMTRAAARIAAAVLLLAALARERRGRAAAAPTLAPSAVARARSRRAATTATDPNALATPPSPSIPPPGHRLTSKRAIAIAERGAEDRARQTRAPRLLPDRVHEGHDAVAGVALHRSDRRGDRPGDDRRRDRRGAGGVDRLPGAVDDGARLRRRVRARASTPGTCGSRCACCSWRRSCDSRAGRCRRGCTSTCSCCSASRSRSRSSTHARIGLSMPLVYPLLALPARAHAARRAARRPRAEPLRLLVPGLVAGGRAGVPVGFRVGLNVTNSNVIDVGYSGVIGADRLVARQAALRRTGRRTTPPATRTGPSTTTPTCRSSGSWPWSGTLGRPAGRARAPRSSSTC